MKKTFLFSAVLVSALAAAAPFVAQRTTSTLLFTSKGNVSSDTPAVTRDGRRIYFLHDSTALFMYDRTTSRETLILAGNLKDPALSPSGDRLAFRRKGEDGAGPFIWVLPLDPRTGFVAGTPRRVSMTRGMLPSFSSDGTMISFLAFPTDTACSLAIVPAAGGPERVLVQGRADYAPIQWTADNKTIYYGLSYWSRPDKVKDGTYRIAVAGGASQLVVPAGDWSAYPGLSPDGRTLMVRDRTGDSIVVVSVDGRRITSYKQRDDELRPDVWSGDGRAITYSNARPRVIKVRSLVDGTDRAATESISESFKSRWSPDGSRVAVIGSPPAEIVISNADGSSRRVLRTKYPVYQNWGLYWSPDGRSIAYRARGTLRTLGIVDVATGAERADFVAAASAIAPRWRSDSRAILYTRSDSVLARDSTLSVAIHEITMDGADRLLRTLRLNCTDAGLVPGLCSASFINDSTLVAWGAAFPREYRSYNLRNQSAARVIHTQTVAGQGFTTSADGRWLAMGKQAQNGENRLIDVVSSDGASKKTVTLPVAVAGGFWISANGQQLLVASESASQLMVTVHRVDVESGSVTRLTTINRLNRTAFHPEPSPDGRMLIWAEMQAPSVSFHEVNLSALLRSGGPDPQR